MSPFTRREIRRDPYGYCPRCGCAGKTRERRPDGNDECTAGHQYPSTAAREVPPEGTRWWQINLARGTIEPVLAVQSGNVYITVLDRWGAPQKRPIANEYYKTYRLAREALQSILGRDVAQCTRDLAVAKERYAKACALPEESPV